jgi:beta-xylosidase
MRIFTSVVFACSLLIIGANAFINPVIPSGDNPDPGAILYNGSYYIVTTGGDGNGNKFPIHMSTNLQDWTSQGFAIPVGNISEWIDSSSGIFWAPEIHVVNGTFNLYYTARD